MVRAACEGRLCGGALSDGGRGDLSSFVASVRQLGVAADLERIIAELDGIGALLADNQPLAQSAEYLRQQLRRLLHELAAVGYMQ